jgi:DNA-directed RNA polymerase subunit omega
MTVPIEKMTEKNKSLFTLVLAVARRAAQLTAGSTPLVKPTSKKPSTIALQEFAEHKVSYQEEGEAS